MHPPPIPPDPPIPAVFEAMFEILPIGLALYDRDLVLLRRNRHIDALYPASAARLTPGNRYADILRHAAEAGEFGTILGPIEAFIDGVLAGGSRDFQRKDGHWLRLTDYVLDGGARLVTHEDVSELRRAQDELARTDRLESMALLVAGLAHEINTPVGIALTATTFLAERVRDVDALFRAQQMKRADLDGLFDTAQQSIDLSIDQLNQAARLIGSFKTVSVEQAHEYFREIDLASYLRDIVASVAPSLRKNHHRILVETPKSVLLHTYPGVIAQIIINLVMNSHLHAYPDGRKGVIAITLEAGPQQVILRYTDDGNGVAPEHLARLFEPFFTTKRGEGGSGLGLSIVRNLVTEKLGGTVNVTSRAPQGLSFVITLPVISAV